MRFIPFIAISFAVAGCAPELVAVRTDGQMIADNAALKRSYEVDQAICRGEMQKANLSKTYAYVGGIAALAEAIGQQQATADVYSGCMAEKGYAMVAPEQAEAKRSEYGEAAAVAPTTIANR